jgi:hypothetical protein
VVSDRILRDALNAPNKAGLEPHRRAILELRRKSYSWREIADFLTERGVSTDHTKVFRFITRTKGGPKMRIPTAQEYQSALTKVDMKEKQRTMLRAHYLAHNRTITFGELAEAAGESTYRVANLTYGTFARKLGEILSFPFVDLDASGTKFQSSVIGMGVPPEYSASNEFELVMHHELAKAIEELEWFPN